MFMFQESKFRSRAIGLRIKETKEVYEGEVTELTPVETESPTAAAGSGSASGGGPVYGKTISHLIIGKGRRPRGHFRLQALNFIASQDISL